MMFYVHAQMVVFSEHAKDIYCSMHMPIGWEGLSMPNDGCSVCMPIIIYSKLRGAKQDSVLYMVKVILTHILHQRKVQQGTHGNIIHAGTRGEHQKTYAGGMESRPMSREIELLRTYWSNLRTKIL